MNKDAITLHFQMDSKRVRECLTTTLHVFKMATALGACSFPVSCIRPSKINYIPVYFAEHAKNTGKTVGYNYFYNIVVQCLTTVN